MDSISSHYAITTREVHETKPVSTVDGNDGDQDDNDFEDFAHDAPNQSADPTSPTKRLVKTTLSAAPKRRKMDVCGRMVELKSSGTRLNLREAAKVRSKRLTTPPLDQYKVAAAAENRTRPAGPRKIPVSPSKTSTIQKSTSSRSISSLSIARGISSLSSSRNIAGIDVFRPDPSNKSKIPAGIKEDASRAGIAEELLKPSTQDTQSARKPLSTSRSMRSLQETKPQQNSRLLPTQHQISTRLPNSLQASPSMPSLRDRSHLDVSRGIKPTAALKSRIPRSTSISSVPTLRRSESVASIRPTSPRNAPVQTSRGTRIASDSSKRRSRKDASSIEWNMT